MKSEQNIKTSKFLSLVLRHQPEKISLQLDSAGWADVEELLALSHLHGVRLTRNLLEEIVATNDKKRFAFSEDGKRIRANQGHSVTVELGYEPRTPPVRLYHGTASRFLEAIRREGLKKGARHHVHLSPDPATAVQVGKRRGKPVILVIQTDALHAAGYAFYLSENGVWLVDEVPAKYIVFPE